MTVLLYVAFMVRLTMFSVGLIRAIYTDCENRIEEGEKVYFFRALEGKDKDVGIVIFREMLFFQPPLQRIFDPVELVKDFR
jgi:hypothetical protein